MSKYRYALINRPAGFETLPRGLSWTVESRPAPGEAHHILARHGILVTDRPLTLDEIISYELGMLVDLHQDLATRVAVGLESYAQDIIELAGEAPGFAADMIIEEARAQMPTPYFSIADRNCFVMDVLSRLGAVELAA